mmetsp:Transcript_16114/g.19975  ORF Transcript_16114/g.19975 Transcript_16114/m.19975 type:complete len:219 (-) Transcript_16114:1036-1692(-)
MAVTRAQTAQVQSESGGKGQDSITKVKRPPRMLDPDRMPFWLYVPNLVGYLRWVCLFAAMYAPDTHTGLWCLTASLVLDFFDGPLARRYNMCTQFGDLLDHICDHVTIVWAVYMTSSREINVAVNVVHFVVTITYMAYYGHYFKHSSRRNKIAAAIEQNNYWNIYSVLWAGNSMVIPLLKMSYALDHGISSQAETTFVTVLDMLGMLVCAAYTVSVFL